MRATHSFHEIDGAFADWIGARPLSDGDIRVRVPAPIYSADMLIADPQAVACRMFVKVPDDDLGEVLVHNADPHETPGGSGI